MDNPLRRAFSDLGLRPGDTVLVHSDLTLPRCLVGGGTWRDALGYLHRALVDTVRTTGTILAPTFTYGFCHGAPYDHDRTPGETGMYGNYLRRQPGAKRSLHPIYSFAGLGQDADSILSAVSHSSFGQGSVFERLVARDAKVLFCGVPFQRCTLVHHVEQCHNVPYRFSRYHTGQITVRGDQYLDTYEQFCRHLDRDVVVDFTALEQRLWADDHLAHTEVMGHHLLMASAKTIHDTAAALLTRYPYGLLARRPDDRPVLVKTDRYHGGICDPSPDDGSPLQMVEQLCRLDGTTIVSDHHDAALRLIGAWLPGGVEFQIETYAPTESVWTWRVPERYVVHEAHLTAEDGEVIADYRANPLHLVSYSPPVDRWVTWHELQQHLHSEPGRPDALPWRFRYYERDWGFCITQRTRDRLDQREQRAGGMTRYHAVVRSEYVADPERGLTLGVAVLPGRGLPGELLVMAHTCHPRQANDDAAGVAVLVEVARRLVQRPMPEPHRAVRFLFCPETIGSVCYLSQHPEVVERTSAGIFVEMPGTKREIVLQRSYPGDTRQHPRGNRIDRIANEEARWRLGGRLIERKFRCSAANDEMVLNGPGLQVPCISLARYPYPEYHTSDDTPEIIDPARLDEMAALVEGTIRVYCTDYIPARRFTGPIFLSGYGLFSETGLRVYDREMVMLRLEGDHTVFEIAEEIDRDYWSTRSFCEELRAKGLVEAMA